MLRLTVHQNGSRAVENLYVATRHTASSMIRFIPLFALPLLLAPGLLGCNPDDSGSRSEVSSGTIVTNGSAREVSVPAGPQSGRPRLNWGNNQLLLSWTEPAEDSLNALWYATWTGSGWSEPQTAATGRNWFVNWADTPGVVGRHDGGLLAHYLVSQANEDNPYAYDIHLATSSDGVWNDPTLLNNDGTPTEHGFVSVIPGLDAFVWLDGRGYETTDAMSLRFARLDAEGVFSDSAVLDDRVCDCCPTDAVQTEKGAVVVYRDRSPDEVRDIAIVRLVDGRWSEPASVHADGWEINGCPVNGPAVAAAGERVAVAWFTGAGEQPRVLAAFSSDGGASFGPPTQVDDGDAIGRVDIVFSDDGTATVSWLERDGEAVALRIRGVHADGVTPARTVAHVAAGRASGYPVLAVLGDSLLVAWTEPEAEVPLRTAILPGDLGGAPESR